MRQKRKCLPSTPRNFTCYKCFVTYLFTVLKKLHKRMSDDEGAISRFLAQPDFYRAIGVGRNFTSKELTTRYRELATKFHPDRNKDPRAAEAFARLSNIKDTLSDDRKRFEYDQTTYSSTIPEFSARAKPQPKPKPKPNSRRFSVLISAVIALIILIYALGGGDGARTRVRIEDIKGVIQFTDSGADYELLWTNPSQKRFYLPRGWAHSMGLDDANEKVRLCRLADAIFWEYTRDMCEKESAKPGSSKPHCAELQNRMM